MLNHKHFFYIVFFQLLFLVSCGDSKSNPLKEKFLILDYKPNSLGVGPGHFELIETSLKGLKSLTPLSSDNVHLNWKTTEFTKGEPLFSYFYKGEDGVLRPQDMRSFLGITLLYFFEKIRSIEDESEVSQWISWPKQIHLYVNREGDYGNAFFNADNAETYFVRPKGDESVPTYLNLGVVAHEHFHHYFFSLFNINLEKNNLFNFGPECAHPLVELKKDKLSENLLNPYEVNSFKMSSLHMDSFIKRNRTLILQTLFRGWNEGLADFWGFLVTQDPNFMYSTLSMARGKPYRSLSEKKNLDSIEISLHNPYSTDIISKIEVIDRGGCSYSDYSEPCVQRLNSLFYSYGSILSKQLFHLFQKTSGSFFDKRKKFQSLLIQSLIEWKAQIIKSPEFTLALESDLGLIRIIQSKLEESNVEIKKGTEVQVQSK